MLGVGGHRAIMQRDSRRDVWAREAQINNGGRAWGERGAREIRRVSPWLHDRASETLPP